MVIYCLVLLLLILVFCVLYLVTTHQKTLAKIERLNASLYRERTGNDYEKVADKSFDNKLEKIFAKESEEYQQIFSKSKAELQGYIAQIPQRLETMLASELANLKQSAVSETLGFENATRKAVEADYDQIREEINLYKRQEMEKIKKQASKMLAEILKESASNLTQEEQEKLVLASFDNAKRRHIF